MDNTKGIPWLQINEVLLVCEEKRELPDFCAAIVSEVRKLFFFQQAFVLVLDGNQQVVDYYLTNVDQAVGRAYLEYYSKLSDYWCRIQDEVMEKTDKESIVVIRWNEQPSTEFIRDYIRVRGLCSTLTFRLFDNYGRARICISLDRETAPEFSKKEEDIVRILYPHLNNINKFLFMQMASAGKKDALIKTAGLTKREEEIVEYLCQGIAPERISRMLCISSGTTRKHLANIYKKFEVSGAQALLSKLLN